MKKIKALVLLSGGLDSMLAAKILKEQGVEVTGITFTSYFFGADKALKAAEQLDIGLIEYDFKAEHLAMVKRPTHGYGSNMNPCIDCHALMLKRAKEIMEKEGADLLATGEVLGQRPMSQNIDALRLVEKISGLSGRLLRPLSAKLLDLTEPEKEGKIRREMLYDISGRSRQAQMELAANFGLKNYPSPAGGCLLTDPSFSKRLKVLFENQPDCGGEDIELLKCGRIHWLGADDGKTLVAIGRNHEENEKLASLARAGDILLELARETGPTALVRNFQFSIFNFQTKPGFIEADVPRDIDKIILNQENILEVAAALTGYYAPKVRGKRVKVNVKKIKREKYEGDGI